MVRCRFRRCLRAREPLTPLDITSHSREGIAVDWRSRAACRTEDPELFFPVGTSGPALVQLARAKSVCRRCPVLIQCRTWAVTTGQSAGVWGGVSEDERRAMLRRDRVDLLLPRGLLVPPQPQHESGAGAARSGRRERHQGVSGRAGDIGRRTDGAS
jgi:WhiB family transcriptional regulator, redox-sensing transcriptional regulator